MHRHTLSALVLRYAARLVLASALPTLAVSQYGFAQGSEYTLVYSSTITVGDYAGDADIAECRVNDHGVPSRQVDSPRVIASQTLRELDPGAVAVCPGGYVLAYTVERSDSAGHLDRDVYARRIDSLGADVWSLDDYPIAVIAQSRVIEEHPRVLALPDGSFLIAYEVRYGNAPSSDIDIAVAHVAADGRPVGSPFWAVRSKKVERIASLLSNGSDGAYLVIDVEVYRDTVLVNADVVLQRIASDGVVGWKDSPEPVSVATSKHLERNASAVSDGQRGVFVAYELEYIGEGRNGEVDILAQRMGEFGRRMWIDDAALPIVSSSPKTNETNPVVAAVGNGLIVAFEFNSSGGRAKGLSAIGLQFLDTNGHPTWNEGRRSKLLGVSGSIVADPSIAGDQRGGAFVLFEARDTVTGNRDIAIQHVSGTGDELFGDGKGAIAVFNSEENEVRAAMSTDPMGNVTVFAIREPQVMAPGAFTALVGARLSFDGEVLWLDGPRVMVTTPTIKTRPLVLQCRW